MDNCDECVHLEGNRETTVEWKRRDLTLTELRTAVTIIILLHHLHIGKLMLREVRAGLWRQVCLSLELRSLPLPAPLPLLRVGPDLCLFGQEDTLPSNGVKLALVLNFRILSLVQTWQHGSVWAKTREGVDQKL